MAKLFGQKSLPKQWMDWVRKAGLRAYPVRRSSIKWRGWYLKGKGRHWRVNDRSMFQRGDTYAEFDRWALCSIEEVPLPKTKAEFIQAVKTLAALP